MEISEIKSRLTLSRLVQHYGLKADKQARLCCPFHPDRTPSLQLYYKTQTCYCFSTNCPTHGKSMDVIDFIMYKESITKHEAILKAGFLLGEVSEPLENTLLGTEKKEPASNTDFLQWIFTYFRNGISSSRGAQDYLQSRSLNPKGIEVGFNSGQFHHGERKSEELISNCLAVGLLIDKNLKARTGEKAYSVFGNKCLVFPLRDKGNRIVSLYFRSTINNDTQKHYYLKNRSGLYPCYPNLETNTLILTESIIDAASIHITEPGTFVLAAYGTNGLTEEHQEAIKSLSELKEIIFAFDMDEAGKKAVGKHSLILKQAYPNLKLSRLDLPCKDVNETLQAHSPEVFVHLMENRITININGKQPDIFLSPESIEMKKEEEPEVVLLAVPVEKSTMQIESAGLNTSNPDCLTYQRCNLCFTLWGGIDVVNINRLRVTLHIRLSDNEYRSFRDTVDLTATPKQIA